MHYQHKGNEKIGVTMCSKACAQVKALFTTCGGISLWPLNGMVTLAPNGPRNNVAIEILNFLVEGKSTSIFQIEGAQICTSHTNNTKGFDRSRINDTQTFWQVSLQEGLHSIKKHELDKKWATCFYEMNIFFNIVWHSMFIEVVKVTLESRTYFKLPWHHGLCTDSLKQYKVDMSKLVKRT